MFIPVLVPVVENTFINTCLQWHLNKMLHAVTGIKNPLLERVVLFSFGR